MNILYSCVYIIPKQVPLKSNMIHIQHGAIWRLCRVNLLVPYRCTNASKMTWLPLLLEVLVTITLKDVLEPETTASTKTSEVRKKNKKTWRGSHFNLGERRLFLLITMPGSVHDFWSTFTDLMNTQISHLSIYLKFWGCHIIN